MMTLVATHSLISVAELARFRRLEAVVALQRRIIDRLPLCPDHRDKVTGRCAECGREEAERKLAAIARH